MITIGRIVHYLPRENESFKETRPAIVVQVWNDQGNVNLQVFTDGTNDHEANVIWRTSVHYSEEPKPATWHWPPRS